MPIDSKEKNEAKIAYDAYTTLQKNLSFEMPKADISIDEDGENNTSVFINIEHKSINYKLSSMKPNDVYAVFCYLNSQPLVRAKYANGKTTTWQATKDRINTFYNRFDPSKNQDDLYLWSGFVAEDNDTNNFLGYANLGAGEKVGQTEMAYLNGVHTWSSATPEIIEQYEMADSAKLTKQYSGVATAEVSSLLQYAEFLKKKGRTIKNAEVLEVVATARIDNPGSWKACAKAGMDVTDIDANLNYGPDLRYQLRYKLS